jgi:uncharacterized membrane protein YecN with MAPEG domain
MSGTTVTYTFTDPYNASVTDTVTVTEATSLTNDTGAGSAYNVTAITGTINGVAIDGEVGTGGVIVNNGAFVYDNALFTGGGGVQGNINGIDNDGLFFTSNGVQYNLFSTPGQMYLDNSNGQFIPVNDFAASPNAPCFCADTLIRTERGDVAIQTLAIGDTVTTADGREQPIRWIGRRAVATRFGDALTSLPVRIKAGALSEAMPARDLLVSPCHALLVDGVLIHAGALVNATTIVRETAMPETFTYYHIELADHALILAEGVSAETFVDNADRMGFDNWEEHRALFGETASIREMDIPRAKSARQVPAAIRARLAGSPVAVAA